MAVAVILFDFSSQTCFNPCEALLADNISKTDSFDKGFMVYSSMLSLGSCFGYLLVAVDWNVPQSSISTEKVSFIIVFILLVISMAVTLHTSERTSKCIGYANGGISYDEESLKIASPVISNFTGFIRLIKLIQTSIVNKFNIPSPCSFFKMLIFYMINIPFQVSKTCAPM